MNDEIKRIPEDEALSALEHWADDVLRSVQGLDRAELDEVYRTQIGGDPSERLFHLARIAAEEYSSRGEVRPAHVDSILTSSKQQQLPLDGLALHNAVPKVLVVDRAVERLTSRRAALESCRYQVEVAVTIGEAIEKLATEIFRLVLVDWSPATAEESADLSRLQEWNLNVPILNVAAWASLLEPNERRLNRNLLRAVAKAFGRRMPRRLPERKPIAAAQSEAALFDGTGS